MIHVKDNTYKVPYVRDNGRAANRYYTKVNCGVCDSFMYRLSSNHKKGGQPICSKECKSKVLSSIDGTIKYKRGNVGDRHILEKRLNHPNARKGWVAQHRLVVEKDIGRLLFEDERVHHINMIADDNNISNLYLCENNSEHAVAHATLNKCVKRLLESGVITFEDGGYLCR